ncbi:JmjC domain, hydroxylase-domain-containing protein [Melampsora americana]|nr:JmjC domain, hydroxylase-domain-containing protein [Melampsora americana]
MNQIPSDRRRKPSRISNSLDPSVIERNKRTRRPKHSSQKSNHSSKAKPQIKPIAPTPSRNPLRAHLSIQNQINKLDTTSIRTEAPRQTPTILPEDRLFGLEHCPVFYPTVEEFKDPMKYFELIGHKLRNFGIGKIVPPDGWRAPCMLDTESFKFKTRVQRLNSMEASARANLNFLEQLFLFHRQQGTTSSFLTPTKIQVPNINHRPVDLWRVRKGVKAMGGYETVTTQRKWSYLAKTLGYDVVRSPAIAFQLKSTYLKILVPFDEYMTRAQRTERFESLKPSNQTQQSPTDSLSPLTSPVDENREVGNIVELRKGSTSNEFVNPNHTPIENNSISRETSNWDDKVDRGGEICEICGSDEDDPNILLCDCCDKGFHLQCLTPALVKVPEGNWFCDKCILSTGNEFGFEEGEEYDLTSFQLRADRFKQQWIESHPIPEKSFKLRSPLRTQSIQLEGNQEEAEGQDAEWGLKEFQDELALEDHIEREFWRLVESQAEAVEVEYGADIHSSTYGSAFPHVEKHPLEPYAKDGWNLNNLPIAPGSLLRYIKSDIAGMTQPWIYVGMVFSTFAWHKEDHYTYSVNYHHWGDTKTWYGVPGEDDEKLETAMKQAAPELFEQQPDVMYQLVTLMSPGRLKRSGIRTYVCDQRPNEFVVTCPRSYHSGFNHGFNLNEAVNFCLPDWLKDGKLCVEHYKVLHKLPVFSHDELLMTIFTYEKSPRVSRWLLPHFREMVTRELRERDNARKTITNLSSESLIITEDLPEDQIQCHYCKSLGYLSHLTLMSNLGKVSCLEHAHTLGDGIKLLRLKFSDQDLEVMLARVSNRSTKAGRVMDLTNVEQRTSGRKVSQMILHFTI